MGCGSLPKLQLLGIVRANNADEGVASLAEAGGIRPAAIAATSAPFVLKVPRHVGMLEISEGLLSSTATACGPGWNASIWMPLAEKVGCRERDRLVPLDRLRKIIGRCVILCSGQLRVR